ncbi:MAG: fimbrillin family protein [Marinifilaceae bacterium]
MKFKSNYSDMHKYYITCVLLTGLFSCSVSQDDFSDNDIAISISNKLTVTRINSQGFSANDTIGLFVYHAQSQQDVVENGNNAACVISDSLTGKMDYVGEPIFFPTGSNLDVYGYFPYSSQITDNELIVDLTQQETISERIKSDILIASNKEINKNSENVSIAFKHVMSKITLNLKAGLNVSANLIQSLNADNINFVNFPSGARLNIISGDLDITNNHEFIPYKHQTHSTGYDATFSAILLPHTNSSINRKVVFTVGTGYYIWELTNVDIFETGKHYVYDITITQKGLSINRADINNWDVVDNGNSIPINIGVSISKVKIRAGSYLREFQASAPLVALQSSTSTVTLSQSYYISKNEITNAQYCHFLNLNSIRQDGIWLGAQSYSTQPLIYPSSSTSNWGITWDATNQRWVPVQDKEQCPVINVTWYGAKEYALWVGGDLPTEAQWEFAAKGTIQGLQPFGLGSGKLLNGEKANINGRFIYDVDQGGNIDLGTGNGIFLGMTTNVGKYPSNGYGINDMHGNVSEWCNDWVDNIPYTPVIDPVGPVTGTLKVVKGGSWNDKAMDAKTLSRQSFLPSEYSEKRGFRVVFIP